MALSGGNTLQFPSIALSFSVACTILSSLISTLSLSLAPSHTCKHAHTSVCIVRHAILLAFTRATKSVQCARLICIGTYTVHYGSQVHRTTKTESPMCLTISNGALCMCRWQYDTLWWCGWPERVRAHECVYVHMNEHVYMVCKGGLYANQCRNEHVCCVRCSTRHTCVAKEKGISR